MFQLVSFLTFARCIGGKIHRAYHQNDAEFASTPCRFVRSNIDEHNVGSLYGGYVTNYVMQLTIINKLLLRRGGLRRTGGWFREGDNTLRHR